MENLHSLLERQSILTKELERINVNFRKDSASRKTSEYLVSRLTALDKWWKEFEENHNKLKPFEDNQYEYFQKKIYDYMRDYYMKTKEMISLYEEPKIVTFSLPTFEEYSYQGGDLISQQETNFRALKRLINRINIEELEEKWELEDELKNLQHLWKVIDTIHLRLDNQLKGGNDEYESKFLQIEALYLNLKKELNRKLNSTAHLEHATPKLEVPTFFGKYTQWPTFFDLFVETIHNNKCLSKAQKMQHLKTKVKGEAEGLITHLNISAENYDAAWEILTHRYNNPQILFSTQIDIFLNQPPISKNASYHAFKKLHDTTTQCINSIRNMGIDIATWDPIIVHLLLKKLDEETRTDFMELRDSPRDLILYSEFLHFLENKFMAREPVGKKERLVPSHSHKPDIVHQKTNDQKFSSRNAPFFKNYQYQSNASYNKKYCPLCKSPHNLFQCKRFLSQSADVQLRTISKHNICRNCLYKHYDNKCISTKRCKECNGDHNSIIHNAISLAQRDSEGSSTSHNNHKVNYVASEDEEILLTTVMINIRASDGNFMQFRALLDQGSQISLISENAVQLLGLKRQFCRAAVSGIGSTQKQSKGLVTLDCESIYNDYHFTTEALVVSRVINNLPNASFKKQYWSHLSHTRLADPDYNISKPIDLLLDASVYSDIIMSGLIKGPIQAPIGQQTKLGWVLSGNVKTFACHVVLNDVNSISRFWEVEDISESASSLSSSEQYCEEYYQLTTKRLSSGQYEVALPMKPNFEQEMGASKSKAVAQFIQQEKRMSKNLSLAESYRKFMREYEELGHMCKVEPQGHTACYLPHHGVLKLDSTTTPLRVVFNASSKMSSGHSLNDLMYSGPNLQQDLQDLLLRWRQYRYVLTADVEKMFRAILVRPQDQHLQSILWRNQTHEILQEYNLTTVTYGTKAAPFLAMRTLKQIGRNHTDQYPLAASALESSFYFDDYLGGSNSVQHARQLQQELIEVLKGAGMNLRKWSSNETQLIEHLPPEQINAPFEFKDTESRKTLGLRWTPTSDMFIFDNMIEYRDSDKSFTKRKLLSDISKIFDPLGWLSPLTIRAKMLFQTTWNTQLSWDEELPALISLEWQKLRADLRNINIYSIPRYLGETEKGMQIHGFCDASEKAYACAIYIVTNGYKGTNTSKLVIAKTKVAPVNKAVTLPRLELLGALLLSQLMGKLLKTFTSEQIEIFAWTDSMVVLSWLHGDLSKWKQFVASRVQKIIKIIPASNWRHVKSCDNAADCATRGLTSESLSRNRLWWEGPEWLFNISNNIPTTEYENTTAEMKKACVSTALCLTRSTFIIEILNKYNSLTSVVRTLAWVLRYIGILRNKESRARVGALTGIEIQRALYLIIRNVQIIDFDEDIHHLNKNGFVRTSSKLSCLRPFLDNHGILRVGGRLEQANITYAAKHPIILLPGSRLAMLIIQEAHISTLHGGPRLTLSFIREKYWLINGISSVKKQLRSCVRCRRYSQESCQQLMADLPRPRITPSRPFSNVGIDFTGHVEIKSNKGRGIKTTKGYVAVFVCLATKAVHLELVADLSTASFLAALRRMCSRRGVPKHIYSDNGTNFVGASRLLKQEYREILAAINSHNIVSDVTNMDIRWHFNAPAWPNANGLTEAAVKSLKHHLKRVLGHQKLTYEEFNTLLCQIEACLNSRPLCALTENPDDPYLTPGHFLIGGSLLSRPQTDPDHINLTNRWQLIQSMNKHFWKTWSTEYLQQLQSRSKWRSSKENLKVDDVVLIKEDNVPPGKWAMARVQALHPGRDGCVRVVTLKTTNNVIKRPVNKLILLPVQDNSTVNEGTMDNAHKTAKPRRNQSKFCVKTLFTSALLLLVMLISPSTQQSGISYNVTSLDNQKNLFFDKVSDLQHIKDEWKLIVYYNMSTYWSGFTELDIYLRHLKKTYQNSFAQQSRMPYGAIILQLEHELNELKHYNSLLYPNKRYKRGLINGVGNLANFLFGVLDDKFAEQYKLDIEKISLNEGHLQNLIKNQTLIIESQNNVIRRNEAIMNQQFTYMNKQMKALLREINNVQSEINQGLYLTSSALSAYVVLSHLRRMQQGIIDVITDIYHGRIDTHLFPPEELDAQINIITREIQDDLKVPFERSSIKSLYKLLRVFARVYDDYLIMEIKIPLVTIEKYELDKIIPLQGKSAKTDYQVISTYPYLAFNLRRDSVIFLTETDLQTCLHASPEKILCPIDKPIYDITSRQSLCDIKINDIITSPCIHKQSKCGENKWIKLRRPSDWLFQCCQQCTVRILNARATEVISLSGNGIINLCSGCTLKGDNFKIYSQNNFINHVHYHTKEIALPAMSVVNDLVNTSIPMTETFSPEDHHAVWNQLKSEIEDLKQQSTQTLSVHDVHQYSVLYLLVGGAILTSLVLTIICIKRRWWKQPALESVKAQESPTPPPRLSRFGMSTSTPNLHSIKFDIPLSEP